jgi:hypothetical protein
VDRRECKTTVVTVTTGTHTHTHRHFCIFGAISLEGKQLFREHNRFNENTFYEFLKQIHYKFPRCYLFLDRAAAPHYKSQKVKLYFEKHKDSLIPVWLPTASPEFMVGVRRVLEYIQS